MNLDNDLILPNDTVFDTRDGYGTVQSVEGNVATAKFGCKFRQFTSGGMQPRRDTRTVFWQPPLMVFAGKENAVWDVQKKLLENNVAFLNEHTCADIRVCGGCN